jgi:hypothetical protein
MLTKVDAKALRSSVCGAKRCWFELRFSPSSRQGKPYETPAAVHCVASISTSLESHISLLRCGKLPRADQPVRCAGINRHEAGNGRFLPESSSRVPLDKVEGFVKAKKPHAVGEHRVTCQGVEDQSYGRSALHHHSAGITPHQPSIRPSTTGHDASMRTSSLLLDARAPNQAFGLAFADHRHPRPTFDTGDLCITKVCRSIQPGSPRTGLRPWGGVESHGQLSGHPNRN